mmetsp:Transcript_23754/g.68714  ORF Transcript_23754/g.68714 Transcript_23754/m.68714 type:complete len:261 (+) Transcript_23754:1766-2548(+)
MQGLLGVDAFLLQRGDDLGRLANVPEQHHVLDTPLAEVHRCGDSRLLVKVDADHRQRELPEFLPTGSLRLHVFVDVHQQVPIAATCVHDIRRLRSVIVAREELMDVHHQILEERLVLRPTPDNVQRALDVDFGLVGSCLRETPTWLLEQNFAELPQHRRVRGRHEIGVDPLQRQRALARHRDNPLGAHGANAELVEDIAECRTHAHVHLAKIKSTHGGILAEVQTFLVPPGKVSDRGQQGREHDAVEQQGQSLALRLRPG